MLIEINPGSPVPIYEQILLGLKFAIAGGAIKADELIPSVRELARSLVVNPNTVARAHRALLSEGLVYSCRGLGMAVSPDAPERCRLERTTFFRARFALVIDEARRGNLETEEIERLFNELMKGGNHGK